jgi:hypothetical protein
VKKASANANVNKAKPAKVCIRLAKVVAAKPAYGKSVRQAAFNKAGVHLSSLKVISKAKLIPEVNSSEFRIIRMPG